MSVLIKMEMPNNCRDCPLEDAYDGYNCRIVEKSANWGLGVRPSWCPLVEVPTPHGRLGDLDRLALEMMDAKNADQALAMLDDAPTIIPADESNMDSFIRIFEEDDEENGMDSFIRILKD